MKVKTLFAAAILAAAPTLALAGSCNWGHAKEVTASSCAEGQTFDTTTNTCVDATTS